MNHQAPRTWTHLGTHADLRRLLDIGLNVLGKHSREILGGGVGAVTKHLHSACVGEVVRDDLTVRA